MGWWSSLKRAVKKAAGSLARTVKLIVKWVVDTCVVKPLKFLTSWIPISKKIRVQIFILRNRDGIPLLYNPSSLLALEGALTFAKTTFREKFDIVLKSYGKPEIQILKDRAPLSALKVDCDAAAIGNDIGDAGEYFEDNLAGWNLIPISLTFPISIFIVETITDKIGCSLGAAADYVTVSVEGTQSESTLVHELGHCCGLYHQNNIKNLMYSDRTRGNDVTYFQKLVVRSSRHATFY